LDRILECSRTEDVEHHLTNPPSEVDALYDQAWDRATGDAGSRKSQRAKLMLMWVTSAKTGLTVEALGQALSFSGHGVDEDHLTAGEIVSSCAGLVRVESLESSSFLAQGDDDETSCRISPIVTPIHLSARRYLETRQESLFPFASTAIMSTCLASVGANGVVYAIPRIYFIFAE
jgi:hypothetical protein